METSEKTIFMKCEGPGDDFIHGLFVDACGFGLHPSFIFSCSFGVVGSYGSKLIRLLISSGFNVCVLNSSLISFGLRGGSVIASSACLALAFFA